ncbi:ABC transporter permease [Phytohabitans flavus]|uniref:Peptide ABC transporter permease n=1 Tax=Phytohabitans flavus TaxID=1076124 RepID=A0A6F8XS55_9ACTN|nr:ABC transporter permease [Phytohabitans flavus]BCB76619.1 peptide ABC transporter permease [Phytohabitans flavus]
MTAAPLGVAPAARTRQRRRRRSNVSVALAFGWAGLIVLLCLTAQWLPLHDPTTSVGNPNLEPSLTREFLGTDAIGRSLLSRIAYGARASVEISLSATLLAMVIGVILGLATVYLRGVFTEIVDTLTNAVLAVPALLLLLAIMMALRPSTPVLIGALGFIFIPAFMRLTRASAQSQMHREYVLAARAMGAGGPRLMLREVLPNAILPVISYAALVLPSIMITEGSLSYLGFGVQPPTPSWGAMIAQGQPALARAPWPTIIPCIVMFATVLALNTIGDWLRVRMDAREGQL